MDPCRETYAEYLTRSINAPDLCRVCGREAMPGKTLCLYDWFLFEERLKKARRAINPIVIWKAPDGTPLEELQKAVNELRANGYLNREKHPLFTLEIIPYQEPEEERAERQTFADESFIRKMWTSFPVIYPEGTFATICPGAFFDEEPLFSETVAAAKEQIERGPFYCLIVKARESLED